MNNTDTNPVQRLRQSVATTMRSTNPFTGEDISDIACALDWEKNRHCDEAKALLAEAVDKLHAAAAALMIEDQRT